MQRNVQRILLVFVYAIPISWLAPPMPGQPYDAIGPIFPSDGKAPAQLNGMELLETVCPGHVKSGSEIGCGEYCPSFTSFGELGENYPWSLFRVTRGHFLSPTSDDALLSMSGCEPHSENFGGTALLTRKAERWNMLWYKAGIEASQCHKVQLRNAREILVCVGEYGAQGKVATALYVEDLLNPKSTLMANNGKSHFFEISDNTLTCGYGLTGESELYPLTRASIEKVAFRPGTAGLGSTISVNVSFGRSLMTPDTARACLTAQRLNGPRSRSAFVPTVRRYHMDFVFDGRDYEPTPSSAATARFLQLP